jgi:monovalent cation:H+ antiporter-2, CPA2 family
MHELGILRDLAVVWLAALLAGYLCLRTKQPVIAGYILVGLLIGPHAAKLVSDPENINVLSELGVALLLFALGVEMSFKHIFKSAHRILTAGLLQIMVTVLVAGFLAEYFKLTTSPAAAVLFGFICALSSTVVVTKLLTDRAEADSAHGRLLIPILLIQDLSLVPAISMIPVIQQASATAWLPALAIAFGKALALIVIVAIGSTKLVPHLLSWVSRFNSREIFLLTVISICLTVALCSHQLGLSLALGAFLAGMMISEEPYGHQALADVMPLRDLFATVFFVAIGMRIDPAFISTHALEVTIIAVVLTTAKIIVGTVSALIVVRSVWTATLVGVALAQIGEFSFVVASLGASAGLIDEKLFNLILATAVITLIATPVLMSIAPRILLKLLSQGGAPVESKGPSHVRLTNHVVLCGYGRVGQSVAAALQEQDIPFAVIEQNGTLLDELRHSGIPHVFGDAFSKLVLLKANIKKAACLIVTVPDSLVATRAISVARQNNPDIKIITRAHHVAELDMLREAGASAVVLPEFEASVEITRLAFLSLDRPGDEVTLALQNMRNRRTEIFHPHSEVPALSHVVDITPDQNSSFWFIVPPELDGTSIQQLDVRLKTGATVLALKRKDSVIPHPAPDMGLQTDDQLYIAANSEQLASFENTFNMRRATSDRVSRPS